MKDNTIKWRSIESVGEAEGQFLVTDGDQVYVADSDWFDPEYGNAAAMTHWMPVPKLP